MIVTIDGPAGAGKSSAARALAQRLGFAFLDTGAMYRAVTLAALRGHCDRSDENALRQLIAGMRIDMPNGHVVLNGEDVTGSIRTPEVTAASGAIASSPAVRSKLGEWQRQIAAGGNFVCEGRDQGTVVFPDALCKFFLSADPTERARRRYRELLERGDNVTFEQILKAQEERDARDRARDIAPMVPAPDAVLFDSTPWTLEQVVEKMEQEVRRRMASKDATLTRSALAGRASDGVKEAPATGSTNNSSHASSSEGASPPPTDKLTWMGDFWFHLLHHACYLTYHFSLTLGFSLRMQGQHHMPSEGPALLIANHQSFLDPMLCGLVARRPMVYLARKTLFKNRYAAAILSSLNAVPIDQRSGGKEGIRTVLDQLALGKAVVVYPEGERTYTGNMQALKPGIHLLIKRTLAPIVPVGIAGAFDAMPRWAWLPRPAPICWPAARGTIAVSMGEPLDPRRYAEMPREQALRELFDKIHAEQLRAEQLRRRW